MVSAQSSQKLRGLDDQNTLFVGTDFGPGTTTESGYSRMVGSEFGYRYRPSEIGFRGRACRYGCLARKSLRPEGRRSSHRGSRFYILNIHVPMENNQLYAITQFKENFHVGSLST